MYKRKTFPRSCNAWALDSGGFSELSMYGEWRTSAKQYSEEVKRFNQEIGKMDFAAIQDWMCEPFIVQKTGLDVLTHQNKTIDSYKELMDLSPEIPWIPVLQGYSEHEYMRHLEMWINSGVNLFSLPVVGVGSICRRQHTQEAEKIIKSLDNLGLKLHGFGFKKTGLKKVYKNLHSSDSMAWSFAGRRSPPLLGHTHKNCANCLEFAMKWRRELFECIGLSIESG